MASITSTQTKAQALLSQHGLAAQGWTFKWDNARKRGGLCNHTYRQISMSRHLVPIWEEDAVMQILAHEIAHALVGAGHGHDYTWLSQARALGYTGGRTHSVPTIKGQWNAVCAVHGQGTRRYHRRRNLICGRCNARGVVSKLTYVLA